MHPKVVNGVNVKRLGRPDKHLDVIVFKPLGSLLRGMCRVIILLEYPFFLWYL
jgi:hypothetical protein